MDEDAEGIKFKLKKTHKQNSGSHATIRGTYKELRRHQLIY